MDAFDSRNRALYTGLDRGNFPVHFVTLDQMTPGAPKVHVYCEVTNEKYIATPDELEPIR